MPERRNPPSKTKHDAVHAGISGALQAIPFVGGLASELFTTVIAPPLEKRRDEWLNDVAQQLDELRAKHHISVEDLRNNEAFIDVVIEASRIALKTSQSEKRKALANAVMNVAVQSSVDDALQQMFLRYIDEFNVHHIRMLMLFSARPASEIGPPHTAQGLGFGAIYEFIEENLLELRGRRDYYELLWKDLFNRGLVTAANLADVDLDQAFLPRKASELGNQFLHFISPPE